MLRKKLIPAELIFASSLLLAPGLASTGYGQNTPQTSQQAPAASDAPAASSPRHPLRLQHRLSTGVGSGPSATRPCRE